MPVHIQPEGSVLIDARHSVLQELARSLLVSSSHPSNSPFCACAFLCLQQETVNKHQRQLLLPQITNKRLTPPPQSPLTKIISQRIGAKPTAQLTHLTSTAGQCPQYLVIFGFLCRRRMSLLTADRICTWLCHRVGKASYATHLLDIVNTQRGVPFIFRVVVTYSGQVFLVPQHVCVPFPQHCDGSYVDVKEENVT